MKRLKNLFTTGTFALCTVFLAHAESVSIKTVGDGYRSTPPSEIHANLLIPDGERLPAVIVVHGSAGIDSRGAFHIESLNAAGIATLEIDMWKARGVSGLNNRPASPFETMPDVWGAYVFLKQHPRINPHKIGILGFSWGGALALGVSFDIKPKNPPPELNDVKFNAAVAFYPSCDNWRIGSRTESFFNLTKPNPSPVLIQVGTADDYESSPISCTQLKSERPNLNLTIKYWQGATHGFDARDGRSKTFFDKSAKGRKGSQITVTPSIEIGNQARTLTVDFFKSSFLKN